MEGLLLKIHHRLNPLHVYCRLIERGLDRRLSFRLCRYYETLLFRWVIPLTMVSLSVYRLMRKPGRNAVL